MPITTNNDINNVAYTQWFVFPPIILDTPTRKRTEEQPMIVPRFIEPNPFEHIETKKIKYSIKIFKDIIKAIHNKEDYVYLEVETPRPTIPRHTPDVHFYPVCSVDKVEDFSAPFETWEYYDTWEGKIKKVDASAVSNNIHAIWEAYRNKVLHWHKNRYTKINVPLPHVFSYLETILSNRFHKEYNEFRIKLSIVSLATFVKDLRVEFHDKSSYILYLLDVARRNKFAKTLESRKEVISIPSKYRVNRGVFISENNWRKSFNGFLEGLYFIKYNKPWDYATLYWNNKYGQFALNTDGLTEITENEQTHFIPNRWIKEGLYVRCSCCGELKDTYKTNHVTKKEREYILFYSESAEFARKKARQEKFLAENKLVPSQPDKQDNYYAIKSLTAPKYIKDSITFLNTHINEYLKNSVGSAGNVDQYGIDHTAEDAKILPLNIQPKYLTGWMPEKDRAALFAICNTCSKGVRYLRNNTLNRLTIDDIVALGNTIRRDRERVILKHGTSPFNILGTNFYVGPNERKTIAAEKYYDGDYIRNKPVDATLYLGVELEVTPTDDLYEDHMLKRCEFSLQKYGYATLYNEVSWVAANVTNNFVLGQKMGIITFDRSTGNGFEIVTLPGTHKWHTEVAWNGFFREDYDDPELAKYCPAAFISGWVNNGLPTKNKYLNAVIGEDGYSIKKRPYCGMHVHFSRNAITPLQLGKIKYFINTHTKFIEHIAGRTSEQYARYVPSKVKDGNMLTKFRKAGSTTNLDLNARSRYVALNLNTGKPTFEIRIFRSNVSKAGFMKNLDFVHALITWCGTAAGAAESSITVGAFCDWLDTQKGTYKWLTKWLIHNKYMTTVHKFKPGYSKEFDFIDDNEENELTTKGLRRA